MTRTIHANFLLLAIATALIAAPALAQNKPSGGGAPAPSAARTAPNAAPSAAGRGSSTFRGPSGPSRSAGAARGSGSRVASGYRSHRYYRHRGYRSYGWGAPWPFFFNDWANPFRYDDYYCYTRRVKVRGHWVYRRYCNY